VKGRAVGRRREVAGGGALQRGRGAESSQRQAVPSGYHAVENWGRQFDGSGGQRFGRRDLDLASGDF
jgi:hypothetical protein